MGLFSRHTIGSKILAAFLVMGAIAGAIGAYGFAVLSAAGDMVVHTYDGPMMSINFARAASLDFALMQNGILERRLAPEDKKSEIDEKIDETKTTFFEDLEIARERSAEAQELEIVSKIETLMREWDELRIAAQTDNAAEAKLEEIGNEIIQKFDTLIELNADFSFIGRREAVWAIGYYKYAIIGVTVAALLLAFAITFALERYIAWPLAAAASVADRIADGKFETPIPNGTKDETGVLLRSMAVMQANIREMVAREAARAQSAEVRLADALENSGEGVILTGSDGRVIIANRQIGEFFPNLAEHLVGFDLKSTLHLLEDELLEQQEAPAAGTITSMLQSGAFTTERQLHDERWIRLNGEPTREGGYMIFVSDFTALKNREIHYMRAKQAAEEASASKTRFLANMSHELRTPLNAIIGFSEIITNQIFGKIENGRYVDYARDILRSGRHLLDVINDVLDLTKSEAGRMSFNPQPVDLRYVLLDCAKMIQQQCAEKNIALLLPELKAPIPVMGEKAKLRQIFLNLLSNAVKFTDTGGVSIKTASDGDGVLVSVTDTGIGMSKEGISVAMIPFAQVDNRLARKYEGTGLGLTLTKNLVELHRGELTIESEPGKGTMVTVRLLGPDAAFPELPAAVATFG